MDKGEGLAGRVAIELPVSAADVIRGVSDGIERLAGEAGLRIMQAVMQAEVESLAGPKGRHERAHPTPLHPGSHAAARGTAAGSSQRFLGPQTIYACTR